MKKIAILVLVFGLGFGGHYLLSRVRWMAIKDKVFPIGQVAGVSDNSQEQFINRVEYDGERFQPSEIIIKKGNYLVITNKNKTKQMWLQSDNADLNTPRGYGEGEALRTVLTNTGLFKVGDKNNAKPILKVEVE